MSNTESTEKKQDRRRNLPQLFKPGQSGNPKGRPKGSKHLSTLLREALEEMAKSANGKPIVFDGENLTWKEAVIKRVIDKAVVKGDFKALEMIFDRMEGKPRQKIDFNDESDGRAERFKNVENLISILTHGSITEKKDSGEADL